MFTTLNIILNVLCVCVWVGAGGQAQVYDGGLPSLQGNIAADLSGTEERPPRAQRRWDRSHYHLLTFYPPLSTFTFLIKKITDICLSVCPPGVDTDELDSNVDDWEEETIEFFINEEIIPLGDL